MYGYGFGLNNFNFDSGGTPPPPSPTPIGNIFDIQASELANLDDFTSNVDGTTAITLDGGYIKFTGAPTSGFPLDNYLRYDNYVTGLETWTLTMDFIIKSYTSAFEGCLFGFVNDSSIPTVRQDWFIYLRNTSSGSDGQGYRYFNATSTLSPNTFISNPLTAAVTPVIDDEYRMTLQRSVVGGSVRFTMTVENLTTPDSENGFLEYDFSNTAGQLDMSSSKFLMAHTGGEWWVSRFKLDTTEQKNVDYLVIGDSITSGYCSTANSDRWLDEVIAANPSLTFTKSACQNDRPSTAVNKNDEFTLINPTKAILFIGTNEAITDGSAAALASYATMYSNLQSLGITEFIHLNALPRGGNAAINTFNSSLASTYSGDTVIDLNTLFNNGSDSMNPSLECGDGIHPNDAGQTIISGQVNAVL